ncbi:hypothetical protein AB0I53_17415 [Saccharopolyspora sp. NPDC050389]
MGDATRFPTAGHFASYTGTAPPGHLQRQHHPAPPQHRR